MQDKQRTREKTSGRATERYLHKEQSYNEMSPKTDLTNLRSLD